MNVKLIVVASNIFTLSTFYLLISPVLLFWGCLVVVTVFGVCFFQNQLFRKFL